MKNGQVINFLSELLKRLFAKSPKFFQIWQIVATVVALVTGIPSLLEDFGVVLPESIAFFANKIVAIASTVALFMAALTVQSPQVAVNQDGQALKQTNAETLPFTAKNEEKQLEKGQEVTLVQDIGTSTTSTTRKV